ncbi:F5/8 type C domain-containing protein [Arcticibacter tournemirensis]|uniref:DUF1735 domain-containing protein n=1 Tax=Arcticibacter tournemirensis TaxID=699437 RepID=A0A5M9H0S5_9SPHI|nr:DUF1735 domain-containing protein [Arcticibacter tournemirensis]KAA8479177.1 DUF1735 domain-containing protein [Arcticibacter tournemirensis]TQM48470.1 F5/8 type C domain-containing protein [Arcticibacter tournemirensis]
MNTKIIIKYLFIALAIVTSSGCEQIDIPKEDLTPGYDRIYMAAAARNPNAVKIKMADSVYHITYGASFGGYGKANQDIEVTFEIDPSKADLFNVKNGTSYPLLPQDSYEFSQTSALIKKGTISTEPLNVKVNPFEKLELFKQYILPITIKSVSSGIALNESLTTAYYLVQPSLDFADFPDFNRSKWSVVDVSTEEPAEGEVNGGLGIHIIDNKTSTFWHSKWDGGEAPLPHWFIVDMGESHLLRGLSFIGRQSSNNGKPASVKVETSIDRTSWKEAGVLNLQNTNSQQKFFLSSFNESRYIRITILSTHGNTRYSHLAELGAF